MKELAVIRQIKQLLIDHETPILSDSGHKAKITRLLTHAEDQLNSTEIEVNDQVTMF